MHFASHILFGSFELDVETGELWKRGRKMKLAPKPLRVLAFLAGSPGRLVTRDAIREQLWGSDTFVDFEHGLNFCIREIRSVLGDNAKNPRFIETLPRRGYRFIAETSRSVNQMAPIAHDNGRGPAVTGSPESALPEATKMEAYEHYSRARASFSRVGKETLEEARQHFERALALDPNYALAHSGLGAAFALGTISRRDPDGLEKAQGHLQRALDLDPELAEPYPWLCYVYMRQGQFDHALQAGHRAIQLQPDLVHAHYFLGLAYFSLCETDPANYQNAANHLLTATRVGPNWQPTWFVLSFLAFLNGDYEHADRFARQLLDRSSQTPGLPFIGAELVLAAVESRGGNPQGARKLLVDFLERLNASDHMYRDSMSAVAACTLGDTEIRDGRPAAALAAYRRAWHTVQEHPRMIAHQRISARTQAGLASSYAAAGENDRAMGLLAKAMKGAQESESPTQSAAAASLAELLYSIAAACVRLNDANQALHMLCKAVRAGWRDAAWLERDPELQPLSGQPRFLALIDEVRGLPKVQFNPGG